MGDLATAERFFQKVASLEQDEQRTRTLSNGALLSMARAEYDKALAQFQQVHAVHPEDVQVANNTALCFLYLGRVTEAIRVLEATIQLNPQAALNTLLLRNLVSLYELAYDDHLPQRRRLAEFLQMFGREDVDVRVLKIPQNYSTT